VPVVAECGDARCLHRARAPQPRNLDSVLRHGAPGLAG
jgi:hypothetical protein